MKAIAATSDGVIITVKVQPRASAEGVAGVDDEWVRVRLRAPPVDGKANVALIAFFARELGCSKSSVSIMTGETGRLKRIRVVGVDEANVRARLIG